MPALEWQDGGVLRDVAVAVFDLDGTLTDSQVGFVASFRNALQALHLSADDDAIRRQIGPPLGEGFAALGAAADQLDFAGSSYRSSFSHTGIYRNRLHEGVEVMLEAISDAGIVLALATSKLTESAHRIPEHFGMATLFSEVAGSTADGFILAKASIVAHVLECLGRPDPSTVFLAGDRDQDMSAAVTHGLFPVGVTWGYGSESELVESGARQLVGTPAELASLVLDGEEWISRQDR